MEHDLGYYVWHLLKAEEETSLFPEFFSIFKSYSRYETIRSVAIHPSLDRALQQIAADYEADVSELESAFSDIIDVLVADEEDDRFKLFWDFIYYFGGTMLEVPPKGIFAELIQKASIYMQAVEDSSEENIAELADRYGMSVKNVNQVVEYVSGVVQRFEALGV